GPGGVPGVDPGDRGESRDRPGRGAAEKGLRKGREDRSCRCLDRRHLAGRAVAVAHAQYEAFSDAARCGAALPQELMDDPRRRPDAATLRLQDTDAWVRAQVVPFGVFMGFLVLLQVFGS